MPLFSQENFTVKGKNHAFLIDAHGGRLTDIGSGKTPQEQYSTHLAELGAESEVTGHSFIPVQTTYRLGWKLLGWHCTSEEMARQVCGMSVAVSNFEKEMKRYKKKVQYIAGTAVTTDEPKNAVRFIWLTVYAT